MADPTRPSDLPEWATGGGAAKTQPPAGLSLLGWVFKDVPPHEIVNWIWFTIYSWILFFKRSVGRFEDLQDVFNDSDSEVGDSFILDETNTTIAPGSMIDSQDTGFEWLYIAVTGKSVIVGNSGSRAIMDLRDIPLMGSASSTSGQINYTFATSPTNIYNIESDGLIVILAYDNVVECLDHDTGSQNWIYTHGAAIGAVAIDSNRVYIGGVAGTGTKHLRALNRATGAVVWSYDAGGEVRGLVSDGRRIFIRQAVSSHASGAHYRAIEASNGYDLANEGGTGTSTFADVWDTTETTSPGNALIFCSDGEFLYAGNNTSAASQVYKFSKVDGSAVAIGSLSSGMSAIDVAVDQRYVFVVGADAGLTNSEVIAFDKSNLSKVWKYVDDSTASNTRVFKCVGSDGARVYVGGATTSPDMSLQTLSRGNRPGGTWRRVDPSADPFNTYGMLVIPSEGQ